MNKEKMKKNNKSINICFSKNISIVCNNLKGIYYFSGLLLKSEESVEVLKLLCINWAALKVEQPE